MGERDPIFETREQLDAWVSDEHAYLSKFHDPLFCMEGLMRIQAVQRAHDHLPKDKSHAE